MTNHGSVSLSNKSRMNLNWSDSFSQMKITEGEMTHMVQKAPAPAISSSSSSSTAVQGLGTGDSSQNNDIKEEAGVEAPAALLKHDKGWKVEEKGWKGVPNATPAKNQTRNKEEYGYIVTNKRYNMCLSGFPFIHPVLIYTIRRFHIEWIICLRLWGFMYFVAPVFVCGMSMCVSAVPSLCLMASVFWWPWLRGSISPLALLSTSGNVSLDAQEIPSSWNELYTPTLLIYACFIILVSRIPV